MTSRIGKLRYSRRQITKRPFNFGSLNVSTTKKVTPEAKAKTSKEVNKTPPILQDSSSIRDVSVSFLASTPKPGKTQLSRRRPLSAVHESKVSKTNVQEDSQSSKENRSKLKKGDGSRSKPKDHSRSQPGNRSNEVENDSFIPAQNEDPFSISERHMSQNYQHQSTSKNVPKQKPLSQRRNLSNRSPNSISNIKQSKMSASNRSSSSASQPASNMIENEVKSASKAVNNKGEVKSASKSVSRKNEVKSTSIVGNNRSEVKSASKSVSRKNEIKSASKYVKKRTASSDVDSDVNKSNVPSNIRQHLQTNSSRITESDSIRPNGLEASTSNNNNKSTKRKRASELPDTDREVNLTQNLVDKRRKVSQAVESITIKRTVDLKPEAYNARTKIKVQNTSQIMKKAETSHLVKDFSLKDMSIRNKENDVGKRKKPNSVDTRPEKRQKLVKKDQKEENIPAQVVRLHESDIVRKKSDVTDLDVVLSALTDTLDLEIEECETQVEESAIKLVQKYLVQDVSTLIDNVVNVKKLQDKIKKGWKTLKERQKTLMTLQKKKSELQGGKQSIEDDKQSADNMKEINIFLSDMKDLIADL